MCDKATTSPALYMMSPRKIHISLEGNIGAGKSTLFDELRTQYGDDPVITFVEEPVKEWEERGYLSGVYSGTHHPAVFQSYALSCVMRDYLSAAAHAQVVIQERSIETSYNVFAKANLHGHDLCMFRSTWENMCSLTQQKPRRVYIYLQTTPYMSHLRLKLRDRTAERGISEAYINRLHELHESWLRGRESEFSEVHIVNANCTVTEVMRNVTHKVKQIIDEECGHALTVPV